MHTQLLLIADKSGSVQGKESDVIGGYNKFLSDHQGAEGTASLTVLQFDTAFEWEEHNDVRDAKPWTTNHYTPRGNTALYDAVCMGLNKIGERIKGTSTEKVIVTVITDGQENSSTVYNYEKMKAMIAHAQLHGWVIIFIGSDPQAVQMAQNSGILANNIAMSVNDSVGTTSAYVSASNASLQYRGGAMAVNVRHLVTETDNKLRNTSGSKPAV